MGGFAHGLAQVLKTGFDLTNVGQRYDELKRRRSADEELRNQADTEFAELIATKGRPVLPGGLVQNDDGTVRRADPSRLAKHKTAKGETVMGELYTPEEQIGKQAERLMKQFQAEAEIRGAQNTEAVNFEGQKATARKNAETAADAQAREQNGIPIPAELDKVFPGISLGGRARPAAAAPMSETSSPGTFAGREQRKVLPTELDDLIRSAGSFSNYQSQIEQRGQPKARTIKSTDKIEDKSTGKVTQVITYDDGTIEEKPLSATVAKEKPGGAGGITAYQQLQLQERAENKKAATLNSWQSKLDKIQQDQDAIVKETEAASSEYEDLQTQLASGAFDESVAQKANAIKKSGQLKAKIVSNHAAHAALEEKKKGVDVIRTGLMRGTQQAATDATAGADAAAASATDANPIAQDAKGNMVQWDGTKWAPIKKAGR